MVAVAPLPTTLRRVNPAANMCRQYIVSVDRELFDQHVVTCRWGRIGTAGQRRRHVCKSAAEAQKLAENLIAVRRRRGYELVPANGCVPASRIAQAQSGATSPAGPAPRRQRRTRSSAPRPAWAKRRQMRLPGQGPRKRKSPPAWQTAKVRSNLWRRLWAAAARPVIALMRTLGKPATSVAREVATHQVLAAAASKGLPLHRGAQSPEGGLSAYERERAIERAIRTTQGTPPRRASKRAPQGSCGSAARFAASLGLERLVEEQNAEGAVAGIGLQTSTGVVDAPRVRSQTWR